MGWEKLPKQPTAVSRARVRGDTMTTSTLMLLVRMWSCTAFACGKQRVAYSQRAGGVGVWCGLSCWCCR